MKRALQLLAVVAGLALSASTASAYYHFYHYTSRSAPYNPVPEKFDLNALPNKTVTFFLSDTAASTISRPDLYPSALNAIRQAANLWNSAPSAVRVAFGGVVATGTPQNTPGVDIQFSEMDPLTLGLTSTNAGRNPIVSGPNGPFVPIQRPLVRINGNFSNWTSPSFTEGFFLTIAHEMGHALGLQHTWTSSLMSTDITRATSLYTPMTADDMAGLAFLYPAGNFAQSTGSISGRITFPSGQGIHLASVVAIAPTGPAISALTAPDGTFTITGAPPGQYFVYAHPVPPAEGAQVAPGGLQLPYNPDGSTLAADGPFDTMFYTGGPGTLSPSQAQLVNVTPGGAAGNINITLNRRASYTIPFVTTYTFFNQTLVQPGYLNSSATLVASGTGLTNNGSPAPGLNVSFLGGNPLLLSSGGIQAYAGTYLAIYVQPTSTFGGSGPREVVFSLPDDIYVLPSGLNLAPNPPPSLASVTPGVEANGSRSLALSGSLLTPSTEFYLDSVPAPLLRFDSSGRAVVALPPGLGGAHPVVTAFNPDGQNSMFLQASSPVTYTYDTGDPGIATLPSNTVQAGGVSMIEIDGSNGNFVDGVTMVGIGSSDAQVLRAWVVAPNKILANVQVPAGAAVTAATLTVVTGSQVISQPGAVQILGPNGQAPVLNPQLTNAQSQTGVYPGALVNLSGSNLAGASITLGGQAINIVNPGPNLITFQIPAGMPTGATVLKLTAGAFTASIVVEIDPAPPGVVSVSGADNISLSAARPARPGDLLNVRVTSLVGTGVTPDPSAVHVTIAGVNHPVQAVTPQNGDNQVQVVLSPAVGTGQVPLVVSSGGRASQPYFIPVTH